MLSHSLLIAYWTRNSAVADKPRDAFVQMQWRGWPNQRYSDSPEKKWFLTSGLSRSLEVIGTATNRPAVYDFLLVLSTNMVLNRQHIRDFRLQKCCNLEIRVMGPSRSLDMSPFDYSAFDFLLTFYSNWLYLVSFLRYSMSKMSWPWNTGQRSLKVIESGSIR